MMTGGEMIGLDNVNGAVIRPVTNLFDGTNLNVTCIHPIFLGYLSLCDRVVLIIRI